MNQHDNPTATGHPPGETFCFKFDVDRPLADADGRKIEIGSVLRRITGPRRHDGSEIRGVVRWIGFPGVLPATAPPLAQVGDIEVQEMPGLSTITNQYSEWRHIPREDQTYDERLKRWQLIPYDHDEDREASRDEGLCIDGIMTLLPADPVDWERGPWPDRIDDALAYLVAHMKALAAAPEQIAGVPMGAEWFVVDRFEKLPEGVERMTPLAGPFKTSREAGMKRRHMEDKASDRQNERWNLWVVWEMPENKKPA